MAKIRIGITQGDINGVGYELILKTFSTEDMLSLCTPIIYGSPKAATYHRKAINNQTSFTVVDSANDAKENVLNMVNCYGDDEQKIEFGQATEEAGKYAMTSLNSAIADLREGRIDALVTSPLNRNVIKNEDGSAFGGESAYFEQILGEGKKAVDVYISNNLRVALLTSNLPISQVAEKITKESIAEKIVILHNTLKRDMDIDIPRIAVLSFNPTMGEDGKFGKEEEEVISPVIDELFKRGVRCMGPYAADEFFGTDNYKHFDAVLAMYHDQGLAPFKAIAIDEGILYTAGLPIVHTTVVGGTQYSIAGKDEADELAFRHAIYTAIDVVRNRNRFDHARQNQLKKQYFEKRDDSDKLKLDQVTDED